MFFVYDEGRFGFHSFSEGVYGDAFGEFFAHDLLVLLRVEVEGEQLCFLVVVDEGFEDVVADFFCAAVDV